MRKKKTRSAVINLLIVQNSKWLFAYLFINLFSSANTPSVTEPMASMLSLGFRKKKKNVPGLANFPPGCPFLSGRCVLFQTYTNVMCKSRTGEATNWPSKNKNYTRYWEEKIHWVGFHWVCHFCIARFSFLTGRLFSFSIMNVATGISWH